MLVFNMFNDIQEYPPTCLTPKRFIRPSEGVGPRISGPPGISYIGFIVDGTSCPKVGGLDGSPSV